MSLYTEQEAALALLYSFDGIERFSHVTGPKRKRAGRVYLRLSSYYSVLSPKRMANTEAVEQCPVEYSWGTFCRQVLSDDVERTVHAVLPSLMIQFGAAPDAPQPMPPIVIAPLGNVAFFIVFKRREGTSGRIELSVELELNLPTQGGAIPAADIILEPEQDSFQFGTKVVGVGIPIDTNADESKFTLTAIIRNGEWGELAKVELPVKIRKVAGQGR